MPKTYNTKISIGIIGLGYVGLPLALEFSKYYETIGYDNNNHRVIDLKKGIDNTKEVSSKELKRTRLNITNNSADLYNCNFFIITVPTPIFKNKKPDLSFINHATKIVSKLLKKDDIVIYESTVYPGVTNNYCVPILEKYSKLKFNVDFFCGYSPERINPGDKNHRINEIKKVTSGSNEKSRKIIDKLYKSIITAGTFSAPSIEVAEAAKVIENTQRDVNIALINELSILFNILKIDTTQVLKAAKTKWNFLDFSPGLVGGHCIGVDPYYLTHIAKKNNYNPRIILSGRKINDEMYLYVYNQILGLLPKNKKKLKLDIFFLGLTFKENVPDLRNSQTIRLIKKFKNSGHNVNAYDPVVYKDNLLKDLKIKMVDKNVSKKYDVIVGAVAHREFKELKINFYKKLMKKNSVVFDIKGFIPKKIISKSL